MDWTKVIIKQPTRPEPRKAAVRDDSRPPRRFPPWEVAARDTDGFSAMGKKHVEELARWFFRSHENPRRSKWLYRERHQIDRTAADMRRRQDALILRVIAELEGFDQNGNPVEPAWFTRRFRPESSQGRSLRFLDAMDEDDRKYGELP